MNEVMHQQVGGLHYKDMGVQPIEYAMANGYDACLFSVVKYVTRHCLKAGAEDVLKALHFMHMREALWQTGPKLPCYRTITVKRYSIGKPHLGQDEIGILRDVDDWSQKPHMTGYQHAIGAKLHRILLQQYAYSYKPSEN